MLPMLAVRLQLGALLAADATTLAPAVNGNELALIIAPFVESENLVTSGLTLAAGHGLDKIVLATGAQGVGVDPTTLEQIISMIPGAGTFRWVTLAGAVYPITCYGIALTKTAAGALLGVQAFPTPITLTADGQQIDVDPVQMTFVLSPIS